MKYVFSWSLINVTYKCLHKTCRFLAKKRIDSDSGSDAEDIKKDGDGGDASPTTPSKRRLDSSSDEDKSDTEEATPKKRKRSVCIYIYAFWIQQIPWT